MWIGDRWEFEQLSLYCWGLLSTWWKFVVVYESLEFEWSSCIRIGHCNGQSSLHSHLRFASPCSQNTTDSTVSASIPCTDWTGSLSNKKWRKSILWKKSSTATRLIFNAMVPKVWLFGVHCGLEESIYLFFFINEAGTILTENGERYHHIITQLLAQ